MLLATLVGAAGFPITELAPNVTQLAALNGTSQLLRDSTGSDLVGAALRAIAPVCGQIRAGEAGRALRRASLRCRSWRARRAAP